MEQLGIDVVLNKLNDTVDVSSNQVKVFGLRFLSASGEPHEIACRKYTKGPRQQINGQDKRGKNFYNLQANGTILLEAQGKPHPISVKTAMLYGFKDFQSEKWTKVFH